MGACFKNRDTDSQKPNDKMLNITNYERDANQNYHEVSSHIGQNGHHQKNLQTVNGGEGVEKREHSYTIGRNVKRYSHYGEQYGSSLKNQK